MPEEVDVAEGDVVAGEGTAVVEAAVFVFEFEVVISGFNTHQLDFPAPSFCTRTNRL